MAIAGRLFGAVAREVPVRPGEVWDQHVRRLDLLDASGRLRGTLYLDLFRRPGKAAVAAHYTVQCGCRRGDDIQLPVIVVVRAVTFPDARRARSRPPPLAPPCCSSTRH